MKKVQYRSDQIRVIKYLDFFYNTIYAIFIVITLFNSLTWYAKLIQIFKFVDQKFGGKSTKLEENLDG